MMSSEGIVSRATMWRAALAGGATLALLVVPVALPAASPASSVAATQHLAKVEALHVTIQNFQFAPAALTVPVGTTVTWKNADGMLHTVTSTTKTFSSGGLDEGGTFSYTFTSPGTYSYFCKLHPHMTGTIVVR